LSNKFNIDYLLKKIKIDNLFKKSNIYYIIFLIFIIPFFKPYYFTHFGVSVVNFVYLNGLRIIFLTVLFIYIIKNRRNRLSKFIIMLLAFYSTKAISTIINNGSISALITEIYPALGICLLIELGLQERFKELINAFATVLSILTLINFIIMILNPHGYHDIEKVIYFMGYRNQLAPLYILTILMLEIRNNYFPKKYGKIQLVLILIICTFMILYAGSGSNIIAWIPIVFYYITPFFSRYSNIFNIKSYVIFYISLFFGIIFLNIHELFSELLFLFLGKDVTFSGRTLLWNEAIKMIKDRPLIGYGMADSYNRVRYPISGTYLSAHNQFIQLIIEGGFISFFAFGYVAYVTFKKLYDFKDTHASKILSLGIFTIAIVLFSEAMGFFYILILFAFSDNIDKIAKTPVISSNLRN